MSSFGRKHLVWAALFVIAGLVLYLAGVYFWASSHYTAAEAALERRDLQQALFHLQQYLNVRPGDASARLLAARTARRYGSFEDAARHLKKYAEENPEQASLENRLLRIHAGDVDEGNTLLADYADRADAPEFPWVLEAIIEGNLRALLPAFLQGSTFPGGPAEPQLLRARHAVEIWLTRRPGQSDQAQGLIWRAQLHTFAHAEGKALTDIRQALALDPNHFEARLHLAMTLAQDAPAEAARHLQSLWDRDPDNPKVAIVLATVRRRLGQLEPARKILDQLLANNPDDLRALLERGRVALDLEEVSDAERRLRRAHRLAPDEPEINLALSHCLRLAGKSAEAQLHQETYERIEAMRSRHKDKQ